MEIEKNIIKEVIKILLQENFEESLRNIEKNFKEIRINNVESVGEVLRKYLDNLEKKSRVRFRKILFKFAEV